VDQEHLELFDKLLLLRGRSCPPVTAHRQRRGAVKIGVGKNVPVHDINDARNIVWRDRSGAHLVEYLLRRGPDQKLRLRLVDLRVRRTAEREQRSAKSQ
jgi:hypothetical protein